VGPNLTHVGSRQRIAAELLPNTPENVAKWLHDPPGLKPGALMPNLSLKPEQIADLVAYLESLK
jgi:cytochrome c oxidase subunit 2